MNLWSYILLIFSIFQETLTATPKIDPFKAFKDYFFSTQRIPNCLWHEITHISPLDGSICLEDGSIWQTEPSDRILLQTWKIRDLLFIQQNSEWFSSYAYEMVNQITHEKAQVTLLSPPLPKQKYTYHIIGIDKNKGQVLLTDQSSWNVCFFSAPSLEEWNLHDTILVGVNSSYLFRGDYILINVNRKEYLYANLEPKEENL